MEEERTVRARRPIGSRAAAAAFVCALLLSLPACHHSHRTSTPPPPRLCWPPPPDPPRIEYLDSFATPRELGIRSNWFVRAVRRLVLGRAVYGMARPYSVAAGADGLILVTDPDSRSVHLFEPARSRYRRLKEAAGRPLVSPVGVATDGAGRIYVSDSVRGGVFRFDADGRWIDTVVPEGSLQRPTGLAFDRARGRLYVVDTMAHRVLGYGSDGKLELEVGRRGAGPAEFNFPVSVAVDASSRIYIADSMNFRVQVLDADGRWLRSFGRAGTTPGDFDKIKGIAIDSEGHIYVVDALHDVIQVFDPEGRLLTVVGGSGAGPGSFWLPSGICIDANDRILLADSANHRVQILRYLAQAETRAAAR